MLLTLRSASHQICSWHSEMNKGRHGGCWRENAETPQTEMHGNLHKANTQSLRTTQKGGDWGLVNVKASIFNGIRSIQEYISKIALNVESLVECLKTLEKN